MSETRTRKVDLIESGVFDRYCKQRYNLVESLVDNQLSGIDQGDRTDEEVREIALHVVMSNAWRNIEKPSSYDLTDQQYTDCENLRQSKSKQRREVAKHLEYMIENCPEDCEMLFLTVTEDDDLQQKYNEKERRQRITRLLKEICVDYDGNVDFGKENGREHFHFVAQVRKDQITEVSREKVDKLGRRRTYKFPVLQGLSEAWGSYVGAERLKTSQDSQKKTSAYIGKLTSHALKVMAGRRIVARDSPYKRMIAEKRRSAEETENILRDVFGVGGYVTIGKI